MMEWKRGIPFVGMVPGHSVAENTGATCCGYNEHTICRDICDNLQHIMERDNPDIMLFDPHTDERYLTKAKEYIGQSTEAFNEEGVDFALELHLNSLRKFDPTINHVEMFFCDGSITGKTLATVMSTAMSAALGIDNRGALPDTKADQGSLGFLRKTHMPACICEPCFITSSDTRTFMADDYTGFIDAVAIGYKKGIMDFISLNGGVRNAKVE